MGHCNRSRAIWRAVTTVNAPLPVHIEPDVLVAAVRLETTDPRWRPHVRALFAEVAVEVLMDLVIEGSASFEDLSAAATYWLVEEDCVNARWVREMAPITVAEAGEACPEGN
jgi:hypothetical protein